MEAKKTTTKYIATPRLNELLHNRDDIQRKKDFADMVGVKEATISRFDKQTRYDINTLVSVAKELNVSLDELFKIEKNPDYEGAE